MTKQYDLQQKNVLGEELAKLRRVKNLSLDKIAALTKIQIRYLDWLEKGEFAKLPADVYVRGIIAKYAKAVDADFDELWTRFKEERDNFFGKTGKIVRQSGFFDRLPQNRFLNSSLFVLTPRAATIIFLALVLFSVLGYIVFQFNYLVGPPSLVVFEPAGDFLTTDKKIKLAGLVEIGAVLKINGQPANVSNEGRFEEELALQPGVNVVEFSVENHLGKTTTLKRIVVLKSPEDRLNISETTPPDLPATSAY